MHLARFDHRPDPPLERSIISSEVVNSSRVIVTDPVDIPLNVNVAIVVKLNALTGFTGTSLPELKVLEVVATDPETLFWLALPKPLLIPVMLSNETELLSALSRNP